jgi:cell division protein FtsA
MTKGQRHISALDIGTTEVRLVIGEVNDNDELEVIGIGCAPSRGVRKGVVVNIEATVDAIKHAVEEAESMSGAMVERAYANIGGAQLRGTNSRGLIAISRRNREITEDDVYRVIDQAKAISVPSDREIVDVLPQEFIVDGQDGIGNPVGFLGMRLEAAVHVITSPITAKQNVITAVNRAGIEVIDTTINHVASTEATLSNDEKEYGAAVLDIGADITNLTIIYRDAVRHTAVFEMGGNHLTNDIAVGLRTPVPEAEKIKRSEGCAFALLMPEPERGRMVEVPSVGGRPPRMLSRQILCEILQPRAEEIFGLAADEIKHAGFEQQVLSSVVLTGGGSLMDGTVEMAEQILDLPARHGIPHIIGGLTGDLDNPAYATAIGTLVYGFHKQVDHKGLHSLKESAAAKRNSFWGSLINRFK